MSGPPPQYGSTPYSTQPATFATAPPSGQMYPPGAYPQSPPPGYPQTPTPGYPQAPPPGCPQAPPPGYPQGPPPGTYQQAPPPGAYPPAPQGAYGQGYPSYQQNTTVYQQQPQTKVVYVDRGKSRDEEMADDCALAACAGCLCCCLMSMANN